MIQERVVSFTLAAGVSLAKISSIANMPKGARLISIAADNATNSTISITVGASGTAQILLAGVGGVADPHEDFASIPYPGLPIQWGEGVEDALYYVTGSAADDVVLTVITSEKGL
jgi:hypothetical protein